MAKPELSQFKSQIVFPDIPKPEPIQNQPTQEDLDAAKKVAEGFLQDVQLNLKTLTDVSVLVKDEAVEIPVSYAYTEDERSVVLEQVKTFVEKGFDTNVIIGKMWTDKDGNIDITRMLSDLAYLNNRDRINNKLANESATKRLKKYTEEKKNIHLPGVNNNNNGQPDASKALEEVEAAFWNR